MDSDDVRIHHGKSYFEEHKQLEHQSLCAVGYGFALPGLDQAWSRCTSGVAPKRKSMLAQIVYNIVTIVLSHTLFQFKAEARVINTAAEFKSSTRIV